jgi:UbiD family decarboxylase
MFVVIDDHVNIQIINEVIWAMTARTCPPRDIIIIENTPTLLLRGETRFEDW